MSGYNKVFQLNFDIVFVIIIFRLENIFGENIILLIPCLFSFTYTSVFCIFSIYIFSLDLNSESMVHE